MPNGAQADITGVAPYRRHRGYSFQRAGTGVDDDMAAWAVHLSARADGTPALHRILVIREHLSARWTEHYAVRAGREQRGFYPMLRKACADGR